MADRGVNVRLSARVDQYVRAMKQAQDATGAVSRDWKKVGGQMQSVGRDMTKYVSLPLVAAGAAAVKLGTDFNTTFAQMVGLANVPADEVDRLKESVLDLAGETGRAPQELAEALYFAASAGLDSANAMEAVEVAAKAAAVGMGDAATITGLLASVMSAYGDDVIDSARATDILTAAIREGRAEPSEMAGALGKVLPIASQLGVSFEEVAGATAFMSNIIGDTEETVVRLNGVLRAILDPSKQGRKALKEMGGSAEELREAVGQDGLTGALQYLHDHGFAENEQALGNLFEDSRALQGALILLNDESGRLAPTLQAVADSSGSLEDAWGAMDQDALAMRQAWAELQGALIAASAVLIPLVTDLANGIADLAGWFSALSPEAQKVVVVLAAIAAAGGPVLIFAGAMVRNIEALGRAFSALRLAMASHPLLLLAGVVAGVAAAFWLFNDSTEAAKVDVDALADSMRRLQSPLEGMKAEALELVDSSELLRKWLVEGGGSIDDLAEAALGGEGAMLALQRAINSNRQSAKANGAELTDMTGRAEELDEILMGLVDSAARANEKYEDMLELTGETADSTATARDELDRYADSILRAGDASAIGEQALVKSKSALESVETWADLAAVKLDEAGDKMDKVAGAADRASFKIGDLRTVFQKLRDDMADEATWRDVEEGWIRMERAAEDAWIAAHDPIEEGEDPVDHQRRAEDATRAHTDEIERQRLKIIAVLETIKGIPESVVTEIIAMFDEGKYAEVDAKLDELERTREVFIGVNYAVPDFVFPVPPPKEPPIGQRRALGGPVTAGYLHEVNEGGKSELFTSAGRSYLMAGSDGYVTPLSGGSAAGGMVVFSGDIVLPGVRTPEQFVDELARFVRRQGGQALRQLVNS